MSSGRERPTERKERHEDSGSSRRARNWATPTGNEVYVRSLVRRFPRLTPTPNSSVTLSASPKAFLGAFRCARWVSKNPFLRLGRTWREAASDRPDLLHVQYTAPLF